MQAIFLVETKNKKNDSDYQYIHTLIKHIYDVEKTVNLKRIYLNGKTNYDKQENKLSKLRKEYMEAPSSDGISEVFLCVDADEMSKGENVHANKILNDKIFSYCNKKHINLIWFNRDVEEVFLGKRFDKSQDKINAANLFVARRDIEKLDESKLMSKDDVPKLGYSNILTVLDKFFVRK